MRHDDGGERETLAPVIPLFGGPPPSAPARSEATATDATAADATAPADLVAADPDADDTVGEDPRAWHPTWADDRPRLDQAGDSAGADELELAEKALLKKLRTRSLSVSEARGVLREYSLHPDAVEHLIALMDEYGYLDDVALAEQLVHAGAERKGQGRQAIAQTLAKRGIPRDVADAALSALPDDDFERALEFARGKARSLQGLDRDTAVRRLTGQLARRGYGGSIALSAARAALDDAPGGSRGVRFR
jgi:regulatory protein